MRRKDREIDRNSALAVIDQSEYGVLSMIRHTESEDILPYAVPLSIVRDGDALYFHCAREGLKLDILRSNPQVCACFVNDVQRIPGKFTTAFASAIVEGTAHIVEEETELVHALRLISEKYAADNMAAFETAVAKSRAVTSIVRIDIHSVTGKRKAYTP